MTKVRCSGCQRILNDLFDAMITHTQIHLETQIDWEKAGNTDPLYVFPIPFDKVEE